MLELVIPEPKSSLCPEVLVTEYSTRYPDSSIKQITQRNKFQNIPVMGCIISII